MDKLINAFCQGQKTTKENIVLKLDEFNVHLSSIDKNIRTWQDYTTHFKNWFNKKPLQQNNNRPTQNITF